MRRRLIYTANRGGPSLTLDDLGRVLSEADRLHVPGWRSPTVVINTYPRSTRVGAIREIRIDDTI